MAKRKSVQQTSAEVLFRAAEILEEAGDLVGAFRCTLAAAELDYAMGQLNLGNLYSSGAGTRKDLRRAAFWYRKAFRNGMVDGAFSLAIDYRKQGDIRSATAWFKKAAGQNHGGAFIALAEIYAARPRKRNEAIDLLRRALQLTANDLSEGERERAEQVLNELLGARRLH